MFELLVTLCLAGTPCAESPRAGPLALQECRREGARAATKEPGARRWRCVRAETAETADFTLEEIAPGVLIHRGRHGEGSPETGGDLSNFGFVVGARSVAAIDSGGSAAVAGRALALLRKRTDLPISHVILTHMHPDHVFGAATLAAEGAQIVGHRRLKPALLARAQTYEANMRRLLGEAAFAGSAIALPDVAVAERMDIDLGGRTLVLEAHPTAHTDNDLTVFDPASGTFFLGDLLFMEHTPAVDGSLRGWIALLETLRARPAERAVPGHGPASVPWPEAAEPLAAYLDGLARDVRGALDEGLTLSETVARLRDRARGEWVLLDSFHPRNVTAAYRELEWE